MKILTQRDVRVTIISRIWTYATAMLLISSLFNGQGQDRRLFLPATIVFGATVSTIFVLRKLYSSQQTTLFESETLEILKQRIENLEAIAASNNDRYTELSVRQLEPIIVDRA